MTVAELIVWLETQDPGATVRVVKHTAGQGYNDQGGNAEVVDFDPSDEDLVDYCDLRVESWVTPDMPYYNQRTLLLGRYHG